MIRVIGGGLSGLFAAYAFRKAGHEVEIFEKSSRLGGLVHTLHLPWGLVETAANGMLNSARVEELAKDIGVEMVPMQKAFRRRYIYRDRPRQMPLTKMELLKFSVGLLRRRPPLSGETLWDYSQRTFGLGATSHLIEPVVLGVFGVESRRLSATLVYDYFFRYRSARGGSARGTVAPKNGMGELVSGLTNWLEKSGVEIHLSHPGKISEDRKNIIATDATTAAELVAESSSSLSAQLKHVQYQSLYSVTLGFEDPGPLKGFGCLFPLSEGFGSYGVLFNSYIFSGRGPLHNETWILPGVINNRVVNEEMAFETVLADRKKMLPKVSAEPAHKVVTHWARALPVYDTALERFLREHTPPPHIQLIGNYMGRMGLAKILDSAFELVES